MDESILLFDGVWTLWDVYDQLVLKNEKGSEIKFASLQSEKGKQILNQYKITQKGLESIVFIDKNNAYEKSAAIS